MEEQPVPFFATPPIEKPIINRDAFLIEGDNGLYLFSHSRYPVNKYPYPRVAKPIKKPTSLVAKLATKKYEIGFFLYILVIFVGTVIWRGNGEIPLYAFIMVMMAGLAATVIPLLVVLLLGNLLRYIFVGSMVKRELVDLNEVEGQLIEGQVIEARKIRGGILGGSTYLAITYAFHTPKGDYTQAHIHHPIMRLSLTKPPKPETPVYVWYDVQGRHYLL